MKKQYNIMTSCDDGLARYVTIQLTAMAYHLKDAVIHFFLLHSRISKKNIEMLRALCEELGSDKIIFHEVVVPNPEMYTKLAEYGNGFVGEAYYSLCAHLLLPDDVDRVLYLDAGDTLVVDNIDPYYFCDFQGKSLMVTAGRFKVCEGNLEVYTAEDLGDRREGLPSILRGIFNSGSYMMNLDKMRADQRTLADYLYLVDTLRSILGSDNKHLYWGDQGLLSAAFVGDAAYYGFPQIRNLWHMPYNFCLWYYDRMREKPDYRPAIVHLLAIYKPWVGRYPVFIERFQDREKLHSLEELKIGQAEYLYLWHEYALITDNILKKIGF